MAGAYVLRAGIMLDKGADFKSAETDLDAAIRLLPHEAGLYINRAYARYKLDNFDGALADYEAAISNDPLNPVAYFNRGILRMETLDNDRALADFSQVLQLDPDDYRALYNRAMIYAAKKARKSHSHPLQIL
ncbi:MAG: tetratricopeptide repeat protein [Muribaculaceae bacterium]|nr:tetratricopeptide repeat protein [Muribaculaceae bacterium]